MASNEDKDKKAEAALTATIESLDKKYGKGTVMSGSSSFPEISRIPSGSIALDKALSGGYPLGRVIEIIGPESSGKTTLTLHAIAEAQKKGYRCAFIDTEHSLDINYADAVGVDVDELLTSQPASGEQALNITEELIKTGSVRLVVVDSVAALIPECEIEKDIGESSMGRQAQLMSAAMRHLVSPLGETNSSIIFTNQIRMKIGVMFGNPETTSGGQALKFYATQRLDIRRKEIIKDGEDKVGSRTQVKIIKNKVGPPYGEVQFDIMYGKGIDKQREVIELAVAANIIDKSGAWFSFGGEKIGQGLANVVIYLAEHPTTMETVTQMLLNG